MFHNNYYKHGILTPRVFSLKLDSSLSNVDKCNFIFYFAVIYFEITEIKFFLEKKCQVNTLDKKF